MNELVIDAFEFCRRGEERKGEIAVSDLERLAQETLDRSGAIQWALTGGRNQQGHPQLILSIMGPVQLMCQRCLTPLQFGIDSSSILVLAPDEKSADEIEEMLQDDEVDVIVGSAAMNVQELIEDEALLALPLSPRHPACMDKVQKTAEVEEKPSPFAVLKNLKH